MITMVPDTIVGDAIYCCSVHKKTSSVVIKGDAEFRYLGIKELYYCPIPGCESFQCDNGVGAVDNLSMRLGILPLPHMVATQDQRALQRILQLVFTSTVRIKILMDREKRQAVEK